MSNELTADETMSANGSLSAAGGTLNSDAKIFPRRDHIREGLVWIRKKAIDAKELPKKRAREDQGPGTPTNDNDQHSPSNMASPGGVVNTLFYNPAQVFNRDISLLIIKVYAENRISESFDRFKKSGKKCYINACVQGLDVLEPLGATGLRSIRYARELPKSVVKSIVCSDIDINAVSECYRNCLINKTEAVIPQPHVLEAIAGGAAAATDQSVGGATAVNGENPARTEGEFGPVHCVHADAIDLLHSGQYICGMKSWDIIDLDPYGSVVKFLEGGISSIRDGGLLCLTSTDMPVLGGNTPEVSFYKYGGNTVKAKYLHEMSLRLVLYQVLLTAGKYRRFVKPLISLSVDFYVRIFVQVFDKPIRCSENATKVAVVFQCSQCDYFITIPFGQTGHSDCSKKFNKRQAKEKKRQAYLAARDMRSNTSTLTESQIPDTAQSSAMPSNTAPGMDRSAPPESEDMLAAGCPEGDKCPADAKDERVKVEKECSEDPDGQLRKKRKLEDGGPPADSDDQDNAGSKMKSGETESVATTAASTEDNHAALPTVVTYPDFDDAASQKRRLRFQLGRVPADAPGGCCPECGGSLVVAGPFYAGPLHDPQFVSRCLEELEKSDYEKPDEDFRFDLSGSSQADISRCNTESSSNEPVAGAIGQMTMSELLSSEVHAKIQAGDIGSLPGKSSMRDINFDWVQLAEDRFRVEMANFRFSGLAKQVRSKIRGTLVATQGELLDVPLFYKLSSLCNTARISMIKIDRFKSALKNLGYRCGLFHREPQSIKTDAPAAVVFDVIRAWIRKEQVENGTNISDKTPKNFVTPLRVVDSVDFSYNPSVERKSQTPRWVPNPANWGPGRKAGRRYIESSEKS